ncbi:MAG TPA: hypothetical protein VGQ23_18520, partial [Burkholderiaceae bacterium]|nr:hypothetical protein [Burkholderiaceae bacterium]
VLLDELNAYTGAAQFELGLLSNAVYSSLRSPGNIDIGGMIDFMMFMPSYLKAARLNHPTRDRAPVSTEQALAGARLFPGSALQTRRAGHQAPSQHDLEQHLSQALSHCSTILHKTRSGGRR